jgi:hypothetical protein
LDQTAQATSTPDLVPRIIFMYSTEHLLQKDKVRFYYALKGRDGKSGIVVRLGLEQLGRAVFLVDIKNSGEAREFLRYWKCEFEEKEVWTRG